MKAPILLLSALLVAAPAAAQNGAPAQASANTKISSALRTALPSSGEVDFVVVLASQADLSDAAKQPTKADKTAFVVKQLRAMAARTQPAVIADLQALGAKSTPFWVANMIAVRGNAGVVDAMARRADVARVASNAKLQVPPVESSATAPRVPSATTTVQWNVSKINAPQAWAEGYYGQGVVIGGQDTGYEWNHPTLINQYRGWNGSSADHNHNWYDAFHETLEPYDDHGHGTHTMGTMLGNDLIPGTSGWPASASNAIGVAPGARWIGCRNMKNGVGTVASYTECYQFFMAPTDLNGDNADPGLAADIISNSWGCPPSEGCTDANVLKAVVENVRAAGILTVHSAGNNGRSGCSTVVDPASIYAASFSVGATDSNDSIAAFSSRGPVTIDGSNRAKPEISAPGVNVRSAYLGAAYASMSGTSMAAPHVAGAAALILSAKPGLAGNVDALELALERTALPRTTSEGCGGDSTTAVPNNVYGWGRVDAYGALDVVLGPVALTSISPTVGPNAGGTQITIVGSDFHVSASVTIGGAPATDVVFVSTSVIQATTPAHDQGLVDVLVTNTNGGAASLANAFTYGGAGPTFTDDPLATYSTRVKAVHVTELRQRIDELRARYGLSAFAWTDSPLGANVTNVKAVHVAQPRAALADVYAAAHRMPPVYGAPTIVAGQTPIAAAHIAELRAAILAIW
jgi:serine protease AprX